MSVQAAIEAAIEAEVQRRLNNLDELTLSVADPEADAGEEGYAATLRYEDFDGRVIAKLSADAVHNHWGIYTRDAPLTDVADGSPYLKRLSVAGGMAETQARWQSPETTRLMLSSRGTTGSSLVQFITRSGNAFSLSANEKTGRGYIYSLAEATRGPLMEFDLLGTGAIDITDSPIMGLREIENPTPGDLLAREWAWDATDSRWLYRDSSGAVHWFRPCGTLPPE